LEPGFIHVGYNHNKLQSAEAIYSIACTINSPAVELEFLWDQLNPFFLVQLELARLAKLQNSN
jgi:hypothetical protein